MENQQGVKIYDVLIVGAGPAGCACALSLKDAGLKVALFDKNIFPRDKVCGDAIPGRAIKILKSISPEFSYQFRKFENKNNNRRTRIRYNKQFLDLDWVGEAYICARMDFDNFLFTLVKKYTATDIYLNSSIADLAIEKNKVSIREKNTAATFEAKIIIGADGTHSILAKQLANRIIDRKHHVGSVRAYYLNVNNMESNTTEVYFDKKFLPSYLWIFPLPGNKANVGFGMLSSIIAKKKLNIKNAFYQFIQQNPELSLRFKDATQISKLEGFGLPLGSKRVKISGDNFILTGDAASLIDPFSGEGIGNAMLSAKLAAEQVARSFKANDFTGKYIEAYDKALFKILGREFKLRYKAQQLVSAAPFVLDTIFMASKNKIVKNLIQKNL